MIPALAYTHSPLRLGILTASALCMSHDSVAEPQAAKKYFEVAKSHGERFVAEARAQARRFDPLEFDSILACSRLLSVLGFAFYQIHRSNGVALGDSAAWTWLHLLRGVRTVYTAVLQSEAKHLDPIMSVNMIPEVTGSPRAPNTGMQWHRKHEHFRFVKDRQAERMESLFTALSSRASDFNDQEIEDIRTEIASVGEITTHICEGEVQSVFRAICTWPGSMSNGFMTMLLENEPFALAIYAHWLMLVALASEMWWFDDMGVAGIREIADICSREDSGLSAVLRWPMQLLETANA